MSKRKQIKITQKELKELLHYDPETGIFTWKDDRHNGTSVGAFAGTQRPDGYVRIWIKGSTHYAHVLAFLYMEGYVPENQVDHINRIRGDNRWCNLREVSMLCNTRNRTVAKNNKSGITGVYYREERCSWNVQIRVNKKLINVGTYRTKLDAVKARWDAEKKYDFPNCCVDSSSYLYLKEKGEI